MHNRTPAFFRFSFLATLFCFSVSAADLPWKPLPKTAPVPKDNPMTPEKIQLGKQLYFDPRLSKDGTVSCQSCHNVMMSGGDNRAVSVGVAGKTGKRSSPTVFNAAFLSVQFWDGRAPTLEEQAKGPLINPVEMNMDNHSAVVARIKLVPGYVESFKKVFGGADPVNIDNAAKAIASYERTLITPNSPFDRYLNGNKKAISASAERGMKKMIEIGCTSCHSGSNFAGPELPIGIGFYQKFPTFPKNEFVEKYQFLEDKGRGEFTKSDADNHMWRVPSLRNIAITAPYFHNGSVATLEEAVRVMAKTQLDKTLPEDQVNDIVAFLTSLTGELPDQTMPRLPVTNGKSMAF